MSAGDGRGGLGAEIGYDSTALSPQATVPVDVDEDGWLDLLLSDLAGKRIVAQINARRTPRAALDCTSARPAAGGEIVLTVEVTNATALPRDAVLLIEATEPTGRVRNLGARRVSLTAEETFSAGVTVALSPVTGTFRFAVTAEDRTGGSAAEELAPGDRVEALCLVDVAD